MRICYNHHYCTCGSYDNRECHYCRKKQNFYRRHYICLNCCIGWKSKDEIKLKRTVDNAQLSEIYDLTSNYEGARCICGKDAIEVGRDFRIPKSKDTKAWKILQIKSKEYKDMINFSEYMKEKYTYKCGSERNLKKKIDLKKRK